MTRTRTSGCAAVLAIALAGNAACGGRSDAARAESGDPAAAHAREAAIVVDATMLASIKVAAIAERDATSLLAIGGKVQFDEDRVARVLAPLAGQVVDLQVRVGDRVAKGQSLCAISSREAAAAVGEQIETAGTSSWRRRAPR